MTIYRDLSLFQSEQSIIVNSHALYNIYVCIEIFIQYIKTESKSFKNIKIPPEYREHKRDVSPKITKK